MADHCTVCGSLATRGQAVTFAAFGEADPSDVNGSPETVVEKGVSAAADLIAPWLEALVEAASSGAGSALVIEGRLYVAAQQFDLEPLTEHIYEQLLRGIMLGALDAAWEAEHAEVIAPAQFAGAAIGPSGGVKDFVTKPFKEAIDDIKGRQVVTRDVFDALSAEAKAKAFTVAGLVKDDILKTTQSELATAVETGKDLRQFGKALNERFESAGYTPLAPSHLETVFRTNVMTAYGTGRTEQMRQPHVIAARPYWQITGPKDGVAPGGRSRPTHYAARGKVLRADDPFWQTVGAPPWGYNCRCRIVSRSQRDLERLGLSVSSGSDLSGLPDKGFQSRPVAAPAAQASEEAAPKPQPQRPAPRPGRVRDAPRVKPDTPVEPPGGITAYSEQAQNLPIERSEKKALDHWSEASDVIADAERLSPDKLASARPDLSQRDIAKAQQSALALNNALVQEQNLTEPARLYVPLGQVSEAEANNFLRADVVRLDSLTKATHDATAMVPNETVSVGRIAHVMTVDSGRGLPADGITGNPKAGVLLRGGSRFDVVGREVIEGDDGSLETFVLRVTPRKPDVLPPFYDMAAPTEAAKTSARSRLAALPELASGRVANPIPVIRGDGDKTAWATLLPEQDAKSIELLRSEVEQQRWPLVDVHTEALLTVQDGVRPKDVEALIATPDAPSRKSAYPIVVRLADGRLVLVDGNHRSAANRLLRREFTRVRLVEASAIPRLLAP